MGKITLPSEERGRMTEGFGELLPSLPPNGVGIQPQPDYHILIPSISMHSGTSVLSKALNIYSYVGALVAKGRIFFGVTLKCLHSASPATGCVYFVLFIRFPSPSWAPVPNNERA